MAVSPGYQPAEDDGTASQLRGGRITALRDDRGGDGCQLPPPSAATGLLILFADSTEGARVAISCLLGSLTNADRLTLPIGYLGMGGLACSS